MAADGGKTEKASPKKREDERKKGNIFQSKDVTVSLSLLGVLFVLNAAFPSLYARLKEVVAFGALTAASAKSLSAADISKIFSRAVYDSFWVLLPIFAAAVAFSVSLSGVQTGFRVTPGLLRPKLSHLSPASGIKKMFSQKSLAELLKSLIKLTVITIAVYCDIRANMPGLTRLPFAPVSDAFGWILKTAYQSMMKMAAIMAAFGAADYLYQWWTYEKSIRMTKQEVKDEFKRMEGDPHIKGRIKDIQRKMSAMRMMHMVPKADMVVKNPTHYAVALRYDPKKDSAPVVVAKGKDHVAMKILQIAEKSGVYITENRLLARGLYESVELNHGIPEQFYKAVAELIAYLYKIRGRQADPI